MQLDDFDFIVPKELIAAFPASNRDDSRLLIVTSETKLMQEKFSNLLNYLRKGDVMIFNDSKVIKSLLHLKRENGEIINCNLVKPIIDNFASYNFLSNSGNNKWQAFARPAKKLKEGDYFYFDQHKAVITKKLNLGEIEIDFILKPNINFFDFLSIYGLVPIPSYISKQQIALQMQKTDEELRYQTVYAKNLGSVAAPTAGLHFTPEILEKLKQNAVECASITLHIGGGTFLPIRSQNISEHKMHSEYCSVSQETALIINKAKEEGRRIIAVGTTSMRTLEAAAIITKNINQTKIGANKELIIANSFNNDLFIKPGFQFNVVDLLLTNFHLPRSTLFILVCAFAGIEEMKKAYKYAIEQKMRFFSYGDASLLYLKKSN